MEIFRDCGKLSACLFVLRCFIHVVHLSHTETWNNGQPEVNSYVISFRSVRVWPMWATRFTWRKAEITNDRMKREQMERIKVGNGKLDKEFSQNSSYSTLDGVKRSVNVVWMFGHMTSDRMIFKTDWIFYQHCKFPSRTAEEYQEVIWPIANRSEPRLAACNLTKVESNWLRVWPFSLLLRP